MANLEDIQSELGGASATAKALEDVLSSLPGSFSDAASSASVLLGVIERLNTVQTADAAASRLADAANVSLADAKRAVAYAAQQQQAATEAAAAAERKSSSDAARAADAAQKQKFAASASYAKFVADTSKAQQEAARSAAKASSDATKEWADSAGAMKDPLGAATQALGALGPEGTAVAMALGAATVAITATVGALSAMAAAAITVTERKAELLATFSALAGGDSAGAAASAAVQRLSSQLPFATSQLNQWAAGLLAAGVPAEKLESRIKAVASAEALMRAAGGGGGAAAEDLFKKLGSGGAEADAFMKKIAKGGKAADAELKKMGLTLKEVGGAAAVAKMTSEQFVDVAAKALAVKGAGPLEALGNTFPVILMKAREGLMSLFGDLGKSVEPFMAALKNLFGIFNKGGPMVAVLKPIMTSLFTTLFEWGTKALTAIRAGFLQLVIWGLKAYIASAPLIHAMRDLWANIQKLAAASGIFDDNGAGMDILGVIASVVVGTFLMLVNVFTAAVTGISEFITWVDQADATLSGLAASAMQAGEDIINGLLNFDGGAFVAKMTDLAASGLAAFKSVLGIASPSKVMIEHGEEDISGAAATGVDRGADKVEKAMDGLGGKPKPGPKGKGAGAKGAGGGPVFEFNNCHFGTGITQADIEAMMWAAWERLSGEQPTAEKT